MIDGIVVIGRWSKVELHREHLQTVLLAACSAALPVLGPSSLFIYKLLPTMEDPTPIPETLVPRLEGHGIVSEVFVW